MPSVFLLNTDIIIKHGDATHNLKKGQRISNSHPIFALIRHKFLSSISEVETVKVPVAEVVEAKIKPEPVVEMKERIPRKRKVRNVI